MLYIVPDWLATSKMIKKLHNALFPGDDIDFFNENSDVTFSKDEMGVLSVVLNNINLDDVNLMKMILKLLFMSDLWLDVIDLNDAKHLKKI